MLFQPGEEKNPGGASLLIEAGVLENPKVKEMYALHVFPELEVGKLGMRSGLYMASSDELHLEIIGVGGHGAMPEKCINPILIGSEFIIEAQNIIHKSCPKEVPCVISFGHFEALGATNVIPNEVYLEGTFRTLDEKWREKAHELMLRTANSIAEGMGASVAFEIRKGYPFLQNNPELTDRNKKAASEYVGSENIIDLDIWMAAEDFAYFSQATQACFYRLGTRNEAKGITSGVHTPTFDIDEDAIEIGTGLMAYLAIKELGN